MITHSISLDVRKSPSGIPPQTIVRVGDVGTQVIEARLTRDGEQYSPDGASARLDILHADGSWARCEAKVDGDRLSCTLPPAAVSVPGLCRLAYFVIVWGPDKEESTEGFQLWVLGAVDPSGAEAKAYDDQLTRLYARWSEYEAEARLSEGARASAEEERASAEGQRASAEEARAAGESARAKAEEARSSAESGRLEAERSRASAEEERAVSESSRRKSESARASAEEARASAERSRASEFSEMRESAQEAAEAATRAAAEADEAAGTASAAATGALEAAEAATAAAGMVSQDRTIFLSYETVGDVDYLTLTDESED